MVGLFVGTCTLSHDEALRWPVAGGFHFDKPEFWTIILRDLSSVEVAGIGLSFVISVTPLNLPRIQKGPVSPLTGGKVSKLTEI